MGERRDGIDRRDGSRGLERRTGDRRDSHRVPLEIEVKEGNNPYQKVQGDLGIGGVYFERPLSLPIGALVRLRFALLEMDKVIETQGEVVEITSVGKPKERGTRIRFVDMDLRSELLIAKYLDHHQND